MTLMEMTLAAGCCLLWGGFCHTPESHPVTEHLREEKKGVLQLLSTQAFTRGFHTETWQNPEDWNEP